MKENVSIITVTLNRESLKYACDSVDAQTYKDYHHYVIGDGVLPYDYSSEKRTTIGFSKAIGLTEPGANMPNGTPNPLIRWALNNLDLGEYVCFLDDDNLYDEVFLETMVKLLDNKDDVGIVLCAVDDLRYSQNIDGYPEVGRCDNSAYLLRSKIAKMIEFPHASPEKNVVQDCEYIILCSKVSGWTRTDKTLLKFGYGMNLPPERGKAFFLESWKEPQLAYEIAYDGNLTKASKILEDAVKMNSNDAWSYWKLAEISMLLNMDNRVKIYLSKWVELYKKANSQHYYVNFLFGIYRKYNNLDYSNTIERSITQLNKLILKEPGLAEHLYNLTVFLLFNSDVNKATAVLKNAFSLNCDKDFWAYKEAVWIVKVFSNVFEFDKSFVMLLNGGVEK